VFLPLEHTALASAAPIDSRTGAFARYSFVGSIFAALGALAAAFPDRLVARAHLSEVDALRAMFIAYAMLGLTVWALYSRLPAGPSCGFVRKCCTIRTRRTHERASTIAG